MPELTFKMPLLSRYILHLDGKVESRSKYAKPKGEYMMIVGGYYMLWNDTGIKEKVLVSEIIQYGKHLQFLNLLTTGYGALKYRDLMEQFSKIT